jgi:hypothetical protein
MFKWLEKIVRKARHAEERFDTEFNSLMYQLEIAKRKRGEE